MNKKIKLLSGIMFITILSKGLGFLREMVMSFFYGTSVLADAYTMANSCVTIFLGWLISISYLHTPLFQEIKEKKGEKRGEEFTNQLLLIIIAAGAVIIGFFNRYGKELVAVVAKGYSEKLLQITAYFFILAAFGTVLNTMNQVFTSEYNCKERYINAACTNLVFIACQILFVFVSGYTSNDFLLGASTAIAAAIQLVVFCVCNSFYKRSRQIGTLTKPVLKKIGIMFIPIFLSSFMDEANAFVDKLFASYLSQGSIASLNYAHLVKQLFFYIFATTLVTYLYPKMAMNIVKNNKDNYREQIRESIRYMIIVFVFVLVFSLFYGRDMIKLIYGRGAFGETSIQLTMESYIMYSVALLPLAVREILIKAFQAKQEMKINLRIGVISTVLNIIFNLILIKPLKHMGLALSTSLAAYCTVPILIKEMNKDVKNIFGMEEVKLLLRCAILAMGSVLASKKLIALITGEVNIVMEIGKFLLGSILSFAVYAVGLILIRRKEKSERNSAR